MRDSGGSTARESESWSRPGCPITTAVQPTREVSSAVPTGADRFDTLKIHVKIRVGGLAEKHVHGSRLAWCPADFCQIPTTEQRIDQRRLAHIGAPHKGHLVEIAGRKLFWRQTTSDKLSVEDFHVVRLINGFKTEVRSQSDLSASLHIRPSSAQVNRPTQGDPCAPLEHHTHRTSVGPPGHELADHASRHRPPCKDQPALDGPDGRSTGSSEESKSRDRTTVDVGAALVSLLIAMRSWR